MSSPLPRSKSPAKKRKRPQQQGAAAKSQRIEGIPADLTPVLLHAIKAKRKYLSKKPGTTTESADVDQSATTTAPDNQDDVDDVLARVAARSEHDRIRQEQRQAAGGASDKTRLASEDATRSFLNAVRCEAAHFGSRSSTAGQRAEENGWSLGGNTSAKSGGAASTTTTTSVPVGCLTFLLNLFADADDSVKLPTRRAALLLAAELLRRSAECRASFCSAHRLREYIDVVANLGTTRTSSNANNNGADADAESALRATVQREAAELLSELSGRFGSHYPRFVVAARYLEEREGVVVGVQSSNGAAATAADGATSTTLTNATVAANTGMADLRRGRDLAIKHGEKEYTRVRRILDRADACFEILVPRIGGPGRSLAPSNAAAAAEETGNASVGGNWSDEDEEDDDIDWEEGDLDANPKDGCTDNDTAEGDSNAATNKERPLDHEEAVERTLAIMERSRGVEGGELEIDLGAGSKERTADAAASTTSRETLSRCAKLLSTKHMPRLTFWVNCLVTADGMMIQSQQNTAFSSAQTSLVLMPASLRKQRAETLNLMLGLKGEVARALASAARIGITMGSATEDQSAPENMLTGTNTNNEASSNPTGVGVVTNAATLGPAASWQKALGIKAKPKSGEQKSAKERLAAKTKKRRIRADGSTSTKSGVQIKLRKGI